MSEHLFLNIDGQIEEAAKIVFAALGFKSSYQEGDSSHVSGGVYYSYSILGVQVKLEENGYDYDDKYNYMIGLRKDAFSSLKIDETIIKSLANIVIRLLVVNVKTEVAYEIDDNKLEVFGNVSK
ncbi:MAG TPA: hypothetical protein VGM30_17050 [Puia sp.]|jgi:hypothetical protein